MPLQLPSLSQIAAPARETMPESMTSVLMNIAKERRAEEQLALQKVEQARLIKAEQDRADIERKRLVIERAQEKRLEMQRKAKQRQDALMTMWKTFDETDDNEAAWQQAVTIDPSLSNLPEEQRIIFKAKGEEVEMVVPDAKGNVNTVTLPRKNVKDFQNDLFKNPRQSADQLVARYGGRMTGWKPAAEAGGLGAAGKEMAALKQQFPYLSDDQLTKLAYGHIIMGQDALGNPILIDRIDNKTIPIQQPSRTPVVPQPAQTSGFQVTPETARLGTGPAAKVKEKINNLFGWMTEGVPFADTSESREALRIFNQHLKLSFVNNPRVPMGEQTTVQGFLPDPDKTFRDPDESVNKLRQLKDFLITKRNEKENLIDRGNISAKQIAEYTSQINDIDLALSMMVNVGVQTPESIRRDVKVGRISKEQGLKILREKFGYE